MKRKGKYPPPGPASAPAFLQDSAVPMAALETSAMIRTQIYLSRAEYDFLRGQSRRRDEPMAAIIRSFIDEKMQVPEEAWENNSLLAPPADANFTGPADGVLNHDHYVSGAPKKWMERRGKWVETPPLPEDYYTNPQSAAAYERLVERNK
jgi:hypothetical protein